MGRTKDSSLYGNRRRMFRKEALLLVPSSPAARGFGRLLGRGSGMTRGGFLIKCIVVELRAEQAVRNQVD